MKNLLLILLSLLVFACKEQRDNPEPVTHKDVKSIEIYYDSGIEADNKQIISYSSNKKESRISNYINGVLNNYVDFNHSGSEVTLTRYNSTGVAYGSIKYTTGLNGMATNSYHYDESNNLISSLTYTYDTGGYLINTETGFGSNTATIENGNVVFSLPLRRTFDHLTSYNYLPTIVDVYDFEDNGLISGQLTFLGKPNKNFINHAYRRFLNKDYSYAFDTQGRVEMITLTNQSNGGKQHFKISYF